MPEPALTEKTRLVCSDDAFVEAVQDGGIVLANRLTGARMKISAAAHDFFLRFRAPSALGDVSGVPLPDAVSRFASTLLAKGMLLDMASGTKPRRPDRVPVPLRFCGAPAFGKDAGTKVAVLGLPYDLGAQRGCRSGPAAIRRRSQDFAYEAALADGRPRGWFDADRGKRILGGVRLADAGDLRVSTVEDRAVLDGRTSRVVRAVAAEGALPLVLAGDESGAGPVAAGLGATLLRLGERQDPSPEVPCVLSIDLWPFTGRWDPCQAELLGRMKHLLCALPGPHAIAGVVLTGPTAEEPGEFTALIACHLLLTAADVILEAKGGYDGR